MAEDQTMESPGTAASAGRELVPGSSIGKYRLVRVLGSGGMGVVWEAHDPDLDRAVALKVLRYDDPSQQLRARLLREAQAMARLKHPNVLTVYDVGSDRDRDYIAMELVEGSSLDEWARTKPSEEEIWEAILAAGRGLAAAHRAGLVHRDFKPHNVLRSHDGRVLVTDFGLAREQTTDDTTPPVVSVATVLARPASGLEATMEVPSSSSPAPKAKSQSKTPSIDGPLTQTGALLGTPAYMAPEQFAGAVSSPRTDQFSFCVTAWQLFTGARPFRGETLEELKEASSGGVADVKANLPGAVRAVLARGLAKDPDQRWADLNALLVALERARQRPRRRWQIAGVVVAIGLAGALVFNLATRDGSDAKQSTKGASLCELTPEGEMAKAWTPDSGAQLAKQYNNHPGILYITTEVEGYAKRWIADYKATCEGPRSTKTYAKLGCLLGQRDQLITLGDLVPKVPSEALEGVEMGGILPRIQACDGDAPVTPPALPVDETKRRAVQALRPKLITARFREPTETLALIPGLLDDAKKIGWEPLIAEAHQIFGEAAYKTRHHWETMLEHYKAANEVARRARHYQLEADTWIGLLRAEYELASDPRDGKKFEDQIAQARLAVHNAGDDPAFESRLVEMEAKYAHCRGRVDEAVAKYGQARLQALAARDFANAMRIAKSEIEVLLARDNEGDLDRAWQVLTDSEAKAAEVKLLPKHWAPIYGGMFMVAHARNDNDAAHRAIDRVAKPTVALNAVEFTGSVVDATGKPVAGATVVAWRGLLAGDAKRVYHAGNFFGSIATTDANGRYSVRASTGDGIIAELGAERSRPQLIAEKATLALGPTQTVTGNVASDAERLVGITVIANYNLGRTTLWQLTTMTDRTRGYRLEGLPAGDMTLRLYDIYDRNAPARKLEFKDKPRWPHGPDVDVIVRGAPQDKSQTIFVFRGKVNPKSKADLEALADKVPDVSIHEALVIGVGDQTEEGMKKYERGDLHAVFQSNAPGEVTLCVAMPVQCKSITLGKTDVAEVILRATE